MRNDLCADYRLMDMSEDYADENKILSVWKDGQILKVTLREFVSWFTKEGEDAQS